MAASATQAGRWNRTGTSRPEKHANMYARSRFPGTSFHSNDLRVRKLKFVEII